jgi:hypothetical protein
VKAAEAKVADATKQVAGDQGTVHADDAKVADATKKVDADIDRVADDQGHVTKAADQVAADKAQVKTDQDQHASPDQLQTDQAKETAHEGTLAKAEQQLKKDTDALHHDQAGLADTRKQAGVDEAKLIVDQDQKTADQVQLSADKAQLTADKAMKAAGPDLLKADSELLKADQAQQTAAQTQLAGAKEQLHADMDHLPAGQDLPNTDTPAPDAKKSADEKAQLPPTTRKEPLTIPKDPPQQSTPGTPTTGKKNWLFIAGQGQYTGTPSGPGHASAFQGSVGPQANLTDWLSISAALVITKNVDPSAKVLVGGQGTINIVIKTGL